MSVTIPHMGKSTSGGNRKPIKKPNRVGRAVTLWLSDQTFSALEGWRKSQVVPPNRTGVFERAIIMFLRAQGVTVPEPDTD